MTEFILFWLYAERRLDADRICSENANYTLVYSFVDIVEEKRLVLKPFFVFSKSCARKDLFSVNQSS